MQVTEHPKVGIYKIVLRKKGYLEFYMKIKKKGG